MISTSWPGNEIWSPWQKIVFRFFFIFLLLFIAPWTWIEIIPGADHIIQYYYQFMDWCVQTANDGLFHVRKELVPINGSGDTSYGWAQFWLLLCLAASGCMIWSVIGRKKNNHNFLGYWFRIVVRYFIIINCFGYGLIKIFCLQMSFPSLSQLATPLGDYLPMRLSWIFMGYSTHYQMFSGVMEVLAGILLLFRRTSTFGALVATGVFINVMMLNLSYDIPVKIYSIELVLCCLVLLAFEYKRMLKFFIQNKITEPGNLYSVSFPGKWMRFTKLVLKLAFIFFVAIWPVKDIWNNYKRFHNMAEIYPMKEGVYDVNRFVFNKDTIPLSNNDSLRWKDLIFERGGSGSINTADTIFKQRYHRGYFNYSTDTAKQIILFTKTSVTGKKDTLFRLNYEIPDSNTIIMKGPLHNDSIYVLLKRTNRYFQLTERQFHWLSEYNR